MFRRPLRHGTSSHQRQWPPTSVKIVELQTTIEELVDRLWDHIVARAGPPPHAEDEELFKKVAEVVFAEFFGMMESGELGDVIEGSAEQL